MTTFARFAGPDTARFSACQQHRAELRRRRAPSRHARRRHAGGHARRNARRRRSPIQRLRAEHLEARRLLAFNFVAAYAESPIPFFVAGDTTGTPRLSEAPQQVTLRFAPGVRLDPATIGSGIEIVRSHDGILGNGDDPPVMPTAPVGSVTVGDTPNDNEVVIRFAETLPDDLYRFTITDRLKAVGGETATGFTFDVRLELGAFVTAVVPQPVERVAGGLVQQRNQIHAYFNADDPLDQTSAQNVNHYRLVPVLANGNDGAPVIPIGVSYSTPSVPNTDGRAVLTFATGAIADGMLYRLEIGPTLTPDAPTKFTFAGAATDDNSSFRTATPLGNLAANGITVSARIDDRPTVQTPAGLLALPNQPGTVDEPGHRDTPADSGGHGLADLTTPPGRPPWVLTRGIDGPVGFYNFRSEYGRDPQGNVLFNTITEAQKQRTREVFESFSKITGIRFVEEVLQPYGVSRPYIGLTVVTGDIRAVLPTATPGPGGIIGIAGSAQVGTGLFSRRAPTVVMDSFENWGESEYGGAWFQTAMHEIGHALRLPHSYDLPSIMGYGLTGEKVFPGDYDSIHLKQLFPTTGTDIDVYSFTVSERGKLSAETVAGRPGSTVTSFLDSVLSLYREERVLQAGMAVFGEGIAADTTVIAVDRAARTITLSMPTTKALPTGTRLELAGGRLALTTEGDTALGAVTCKVVDLGPTARTLVARNDDYYGRDSFVGLDLEPGDYFVAVTSTGNDQFNPEVADSGYGGRTRGDYELRLGFTPAQSSTNTIEDARCTPLDGDRDGLPGGTHAFWFKTASASDTIFVDKAAAKRSASLTTGSVTVTGLNVTNLAVGMLVKGDGISGSTTIESIDLVAGSIRMSRGATKTITTASLTFSNGTAAFPHIEIDDALAAVTASTKIIRIVGNGANTPYLVGTSLTNQTLSDGATLNVPKGVTVMIDAGAVFKLRSAIIDVGSSQPLPTSSRAETALQVLGVRGSMVTFTSYHDDSIGGDSDMLGPAVAGGQWGGLVFREDSDFRPLGDPSALPRLAFVNTVQQADVRYGGGEVRVDSQLQVFAPIQIESTRPTIVFNTITGSAGAAIAATPNSFKESNGRIGPELRGNKLVDNSTNGLFVKIFTRFGSPLEQLDVPARFKSTDIVYVFQENLVITGGAGGYSLDVGKGLFASRSTGRLAIDSGVVVKLQGSRIELERGASQLIAEGGEFNPVIFTSLGDNRYGAGGTFDTNGVIPDRRQAGDWGGIVLNAGTRASIDQAYIAFGGGLTPIEGTSDFFNVVEVHQGDLRLANTRVENNLSGLAASDRTGRGTNAEATIFVRGAQPIVVSNDFRANAGAVVSINTNSLSDVSRPDVGRSTGPIRRFDRYDDNVGPLVAANVLSFASGAAAIAGMKVRGEEITVEGVWDDADIVHVLEDEIIVRNFHTATGLRLQSRPDASLVVKLRGATAGITAEGYGLDIDDRIGGTVHVVGQPGRPVVLTSLADDTVGASVDPLGRTVTDTANDGATTGAPGDWRSLKFLPLSNDRNVSVYVEAERPLTSGLETNGVVDVAEDLGVLAPNHPTGTNSRESAQEKSGDENRRLGFEVHGFISPDDPTDVDVYTFQGYADSEVWIDVDKTATSLDAMVELLDSFGNVLARSVDEGVESRLVTTSVVDAVGGSAVTYPLGNTTVVKGTLVGTLSRWEPINLTFVPLQDFSFSADGSVTFYDRDPLNSFHATGAILDPVNGLLTLTFDNAAVSTRVDVSYVHATGSLSAVTLGLGQSAQRDGWRGGDFYTTNPRDPGMRLVLPGTIGQYLRYYVRVRSQPRQDAATLALFLPDVPDATRQERYEASLQSTSFDQPGDPAAGVTSGSYELRVRLRQRDEKPGSVVRYADIRYPTVGIDVLGLPRNSLLAGETGETTQANDTLAGAQFVGNLLEADRNTISIAGELGSETDVDWYQFALNYEQIQGTGKPPAWATVFDLDYADGFRGDLTLAVFDSAGTLLYVGQDSDVRDDQPGAGQGNDFDDVSRGTLGKLDPFIGTVQLPTDNPEGTRANPADPADQLKYYVAVMSNGQLPSQLNATFQSAAGNTLVRLEPVTSVNRVIEDHIGFTGYTSNDLPREIQILLNKPNPNQVDQTTLDPVATVPSGPRPLIDILSPTALSTHVRPFTLADVTLFVSSSTGLFTVDAVSGTRETTVRTGIPGVTIGDLDMRTDGKLYAYAGVNGSTTTVGRLIEIDPGTGSFLTTDDDEIEDVDATTPLNFQTTSSDVTALAFRRTDVADYDELWFIVKDGPHSKLYRAEDGGDATTAADAQADQSIATSTSLGYRGRIPSTEITGLQFRGDSGNSLFGVTADGRFVAIMAGSKVPNDGNPAVPPASFDFNATVTPLQNFASQLTTVSATGFRGLAAAPRNVDGGSLAGMFVAVTDNGRLCVIDPTTNSLVPRLEWGAGPLGLGALFSPAITGVTGITGLAFSPLDINLWHPTNLRGSEEGHGINAAPDNTRGRSDGGDSMYFGLERFGATSSNLLAGAGQQFGADPTWHEDLTANDDIVAATANGSFNLPGGAYGSLITNSFSLSGYTYTDKPTLYFNYWLETQGAASKTGGMRDSARVLISVDRGTSWQLLATNNSTRSATGTTDAELPTVISASSAISTFANQHVQELFDTANWRQARVDLGKWAGSADIRLRFDFHTAGEFDPNQRDAAGNLINTISGLANTTGDFTSAERGQNNQFEGFYIDDIIVGFAERGEMVTGAVVDTSLSPVSTPPGVTQALQGPYQLEIRRGTEYSVATGGTSPNTSANMAITRTFDTNERLIPGAYSATGALRGDSNLPREQGQFVIDGNIVASAATYGISIDAGVRDALSNLPHPGVARNLPTLNNGRLVPGAFVVNNLITSSGTAGIRFSGDPNTPIPGTGGAAPTPVPTAVVPFGRIVNNTIHGGSTVQGVGVEVTENAGPTLMNNLFANLVTGVSVDTSSQRDAANNERTVVTHSGFSGVTTPVTPGVTDRFRVSLPTSPFEDAAAGNFYPVAGTPAIDTSLNSLQDRNEFLVVNSPLGISAAPILAPEKDLYGQLRWDDPAATSSLPGLGLNVFKDLGAIDRVDFSQSLPYLVILDPRDNGPADVQTDPDKVVITGSRARNRRFFTFQIFDPGAGIDPTTVVAANFTLTRDDVPLVEGKDYVFRFVESSNRVVFEAASIFKPGVYKVEAKSLITDRAGNPLRPNKPETGTTEFEIRLLDVPYAPTWPAPMTPLSPLLFAGWHENQTIHLGWNSAFTVLPDLPIIDYDVEMSTDDCFPAGQTVTLTAPAFSTATSLSESSLVNGTSYWFRVRATNALGVGPWSDVLGPIVPQPKPMIALNTDTCVVDGITSDGRVNVAGLAAGARWEYRIAGGAWTHGSGTSFILPEGTYPAGGVQVRQIIAGFPSVPATNAAQWVIDSSAPLAPVITSVVDNVSPVTSSVPNGGFTNDTTPTFNGTAEAFTTLRITVNGGSPTTMNVPATGIWTHTPAALGDGTYTFAFVAIDTACNESAATTFSLTVDTAAPPPPVITSVVDNVSPVTTPVPNGGVTNDSTPTFNGTAASDVTSIRVTINNGSPVVVPAAGGVWSFSPTALGDGTYTFTFVAIDRAGNESSATAFTLTVDTIAPPPPVITSVVDNVSPVTTSVPNGGVTNDSTPTFNGTAEPNTTLRITVNNGPPTTMTVPANGIWTYTPAALVDGSYMFAFVAIDTVDNESAATTFTLTVDTAAPPPPVITSVVDTVSPVTTPVPNGGVTNDSTPTFNGTAASDVTSIRVTINNGSPVVVPAAGGVWSFSPTALGNGTYTFAFVAIDRAGNESSATAFTLTVDTIAPSVLSVVALSPSGTYGIGHSVDILVTFNEDITVTGVAALQLNTSPSRSATYLSGTGTKGLTFRYAIQIGDTSARLDHASASALSGTFTDGAGNPATLTLPTPGSYLGGTIVIDALIKATIPGLGQSPDNPPKFASPLTSLPVQFNTPITGFTLNSFRLERWDAINQAWRPVSQLNIGVSGSGAMWTITFPSLNNPTSLPGRYRICIGGVNSGIVAGGVAMDKEVCWYFDRV